MEKNGKEKIFNRYLLIIQRDNAPTATANDQQVTSAYQQIPASYAQLNSASYYQQTPAPLTTADDEQTVGAYQQIPSAYGQHNSVSYQQMPASQQQQYYYTTDQTYQTAFGQCPQQSTTGTYQAAVTQAAAPTHALGPEAYQTNVVTPVAVSAATSFPGGYQNSVSDPQNNQDYINQLFADYQ